jgi:hypothetical protein
LLTKSSHSARPSISLTVRLCSCLVAINLLWAGPGIAQVPAGQIDLVALGFAPVAEPAVDLDIGAAEFDMAALATQATDPDLALLLGAVEGFHLKQFAPPDQATVLAASNLATALILSGWLSAMAEFQDTRKVVVYVLSVGLAFANVVGNIAPQQLATLGLPVPN